MFLICGLQLNCAKQILLRKVLFVIFSQGLADNVVVAKVNGEVWDLDRPFEKDSTLMLLKFDDPDGR